MEFTPPPPVKTLIEETYHIKILLRTVGDFSTPTQNKLFDAPVQEKRGIKIVTP
jgi:hypothetical protein